MSVPPEAVATALGEIGIGVEGVPLLVANGWESHIYRCETAHGPVAARVHAATDPTRARREAEVMTLLGQLEYPVPPILGLTTALGHPVLAMTFIDGPNLDEVDWPGEQVTDVCVRLMADLHGLPNPEGSDDPLRWLRDGLARALESLPGFRPHVDALLAGTPSDLQAAICHLDFHPGNVVWDESPWVVDWTSAQVTDPRFDRAWSRLLAEMYAPERAASFASPTDDRWFEAVMGLRRLITVAGMLAGESHAAGDEIRSQLHLMRTPAAWLERGTGIPVDIAALLVPEDQSGAGFDASATM